MPTGRVGRPRLAAIPGLLPGQVIKHQRGRCLVAVTRRVVLGTAAAITAVLAATGTGTGINTSSIERLIILPIAARIIPANFRTPDVCHH